MFGNSNWQKMLTEGPVLGMLDRGQQPSQGYQGPSAESYLSQIPEILKHYSGQYQHMMEDPTGIMSKFGSQFKASPGYQYRLGQGEQAIGHAAAAGGMAGSPMQQQQAAQMAEGLASQDYGDFMNRALGLYGQGAQGYGQLGQGLASNLMSQSSLAAMRQEEAQRQREFEEAQGAQSQSQLMSLLGQLGTAAFMA